MCLCEVAAWCKANGITVWDQMINIYEKYGYFMEGIHTVTLKGIDGAEKIKALMENVRNNPPKSFGDLDVVAFRDYDRDVIIENATGNSTKTGLPKSNVLYFDLADDAWCCVRPSGTEPKIKFYMGIKGNNMDDAKKKLEALKAEVIKLSE